MSLSFPLKGRGVICCIKCAVSGCSVGYSTFGLRFSKDLILRLSSGEAMLIDIKLNELRYC